MRMAAGSIFLAHVEEKLMQKEKNKLRKPVVEKMRRDRINSSIEQLKLLLERELQGQQPSTKLEKADILEMAVTYLQLHGRPQAHAPSVKNPQQDFSQGYLSCLKESLHFLSYYEPKKEAQAQLMKHFCQGRLAAAEKPAPPWCALPSSPHHPAKAQPAQENATAAAALWRPW
ncbi:transcription factor HES-5-like [Rhinatrema bivittatum]|uniref:transcription factor HES-5-like n=1 Tax=Rhinatrema bivittatum TaxID=194408 RepID=UPI0011263AC7|nr:transcription factor HES-5-like [Rhinatrema bivittatum]